MSDEPGFKKLSLPLLRRGWQAMALLSLVAIFIEIAEKSNLFRINSHSEFVLEIVFHSLFTPFIGIVFLALAERAERERFHLSLTITRQKAVRDRLARAKKLGEVIQVVLRFPFDAAPVTGVSLYLVTPNSDWYELAGIIGKDNESLEIIEKLVPRSILLEAVSNACWPLPWRESHDQAPKSSSHILQCLKLSHGEKPTGLLFLLFPTGESNHESQMQFLEGLAPELALALDGAIWERWAYQQKKVTEEDKRKIARDLHDVLGHDLAILLLKLEQLFEDHSLMEFQRVRQDLQRMYDVTNKAYRMVRGTLVALEPNISGELGTILIEYADWVGDRSGIHFEFSTVGQPVPVTNHITNQIFLIYREIITNIEKHARANHVKIQIRWDIDCFNLVITDNGQGFNPDQASFPWHYGLASMKERANQLGGDIILVSKVNAGTEVRLSCPLKQERSPMMGVDSSILIKEIITDSSYENLSR